MSTNEAKKQSETVSRMIWTERVFAFGLPPGWMANVLERLRGTPVRIEELVKDFMELRTSFIQRLSQLDAETMHFVSLHPRLQQPKRPVDMAFFTAEHDDHHLVTIREIKNTLDQH